MTTRQIILLVVVGIVFAAIGVFVGKYAKERLSHEPPVTPAAETRPETLPAFTLYDLDGNEVTKDELLANDKALFINFWATWCKPCREEMPLLSDLQDKYQDRLLIVGVAIDNKEAVRDFLDYLGGVSYPILLGKQELDAIEIANAMGVDLIGLPVSVTTDNTGRIVRIHTGEVDEAEATALIEEVL